jgi:hypothetical protein
MENKWKNLLVNFLEKRTRAYIEPSHKGTPKGDPIGFSKQKFLASQMMMHDATLKQLSKTMGISYGVLRVWTTEPTFKKKVQDTIHDFIEVFVGRLVKDLTGFRNRAQKNQNYFLWDGKEYFELLNDFRNGIKDYSPLLRTEIIRRLKEVMKEKTNLTFGLLYIQFFLAMSVIKNPRIAKKLSIEVIRIVFLCEIGFYGSVIEENLRILKRPKLPDEEKQKVINGLESLLGNMISLGEKNGEILKEIFDR